MPCKAMVAPRSLPRDASAAAAMARGPRVATAAKARADLRRTMMSHNSCEGLQFCEFLRVGQNAPERLARAGDGARQRRVAILQQAQYLQQQQIIPLPQVLQGNGRLAVVEGPELFQQVIH